MAERENGSRSLERYREEGAQITEIIQGGKRQFLLKTTEETVFDQYDLKEILKEKGNPTPERYLGLEYTDILNSGRDILAEAVYAGTEDGEPDYDQIKDLLPPITGDAYCFLGGALSWGSVVIDRMGRVFPQSYGRNHTPALIFDPAQIDLELSEAVPAQKMLGGVLPVLTNVHVSNSRVMECLLFVEPFDPDRDPLVWIRVTRYCLDAPENRQEQFLITSASRVGIRETKEALYWEAFCSTLIYWKDYIDRLSKIQVPEEQLAKTAKGVMVSLATTFSGEHAHYGHREYGWEN